MKNCLRLIRFSFYLKIIFWGVIILPLSRPQTLLGQIEFSEVNDPADQSTQNSLLEQIKKVDYATQSARNAVEAFADSAFLPELLFQLSEWEIQREKLYFELQMNQYDYQIQQFDSGKLEQEPIEPLLTYEKALKINRQILNDYPNVPYISQVMYRTGICLFEIGNRDSARQIFEKLVTDYPDSSYLPDVLFRLGECYFDEGDYTRAIGAYQQNIDNWKSPFFPMALYKFAWCHFRLNNYSKAISAFYYLLNDIKLMEKIDSELLGKSQVQLQDEIMEYITMSFSDFGGAALLSNFIEQMGGSAYKPYLLHKLGNIYIKRDFYEDALAAFNNVIRQSPTYEKLPEVFIGYLQSYEKMDKMGEGYKIHENLIKYCGPNSKWAQAHHSEQDSLLYTNALNQIDHKIATPLLVSADSLYFSKNYKKSADKFTYFLRTFKQDARRDHATYYLAECYYNLNEYNKAAIIYKSIVSNYPTSEFREDAAYNHVVCYDQILKEHGISFNDSTASIRNNKDIKNFLLACANFLKWVPNSSKETEIKLKIAEVFFRQKRYPASEKYAVSALESIRKYKHGVEYKTSALNLLMQLSFFQGKYLEAERYSAKLIKERPDSLKLVLKTNKLLASSSFKIGELLKSKGKNRLAAVKFEQAALKSSDPKIVEASIFEAAIQFEEAKQFNKAAMHFENFFKKYPQSEHAKEAIYRAALLRDKLKQYHLSARHYLTLNRLSPNSAEGAAAYYNAGLAFEKAGDWLSTAETFKKYIDRYPHFVENILEVMFKIAHAYERKRMPPQANSEYQRVLNQYNQFKAAGEFADDYFAAQATFRLAEMKRPNFRSIRIKPPFQINLQKKQIAFNDILKSYVDVAKFNIADWSTAAFYQLGLAYEEFGRDILRSPNPPNLRGNDLKTYWESINEQFVLPLQREALKYYQTNEKLAKKNNLKNEWIDRTRARILFLSKKLAAGDNLVSQNDKVKEVSDKVAAKKDPSRTKL